MKSLSRKLTFLFLSITPLLADNYPTYVITDPTNQAAYTAQLPNLTHKIAAQYQLDNMNNIVRGNANAQAVATTGAGTAYAMGEHTFIVGASGAAAVATSDNTFSQVFDKIQNLESGAVPQFGIGAALSAMVGMNLGNLRTPRYLGPFELARTTLFVNAMNYSSSGLAKGLDTSASVLGAHVQYQMRKPQGKSYFQYGEILFTTGFDYSHFSAKYNSATGDKNFVPVTVGTGTPADPLLIWTPQGTLNITSGSGTLPIEVSTNIRLFYFLSFYAGGAVDLNVGKATTAIHLTADMKGTTSGGTPQSAGNSRLDSVIESSPQFASARAFVGLQLNLLPATQGNFVALFTQVSASSIGGLAALVGVRGAW